MRDRPTNPERRRWLRRAAVLGALGAMSGGVALVRTGGYALDGERALRLLVLAPWQFVVVQHLARRMVAARAPGEERAVASAVTPVPSADDANVAEFIDGHLATMRPSLRRDLARMLGVVEHLAPLGAGHVRRFTALAPVEQDAVLRSLESSRSELLRAGFDGLKSLVMMAYWRDPRTWAAIGYPGPLLGRAPARTE